MGAGSVLSRQRSCAGALRPLPPLHLYGAPVKPFCCQGETVAFYLFYRRGTFVYNVRRLNGILGLYPTHVRHVKRLSVTVCEVLECIRVRRRTAANCAFAFGVGRGGGLVPCRTSNNPPYRTPRMYYVVHYQAAPQLVVGSPPQCGFNAAARLVTPHFRAGGEHRRGCACGGHFRSRRDRRHHSRLWSGGLLHRY